MKKYVFLSTAFAINLNASAAIIVTESYTQIQTYNTSSTGDGRPEEHRRLQSSFDGASSTIGHSNYELQWVDISISIRGSELTGTLYDFTPSGEENSISIYAGADIALASAVDSYIGTASASWRAQHTTTLEEPLELSMGATPLMETSPYRFRYAYELAALDGGFDVSYHLLVSQFASSFDESFSVQMNSSYEITTTASYAYELETPVVVPVPASVWLFGTALVGIAGIKRKSKNIKIPEIH